MASARKVSFVVAASVGAVEALKDQGGFCRWNYGLRCLHQHAKSNMGSLPQALRTTMSSSSVSDARRTEESKRSEESLRKVMYLSCWGPN